MNPKGSKLERETKRKDALRNVETTAAAQVARLNLAPAKPATTVASNNGVCGITMSCAPNSAGITAPLLSYHPTQSPSVSQYFTTQNAHYALGACGLNPSVDPISLVTSLTCDLVDGVLYAVEGNWTGAGLSVTAGLESSA